ncbi:PREDICTED: serine/arginine repetitive matrix protein 2 isoform X1 [Fragaria vesca subsp. vesca]|uniref:serine/arginine repetitive matrix protein 2 isoform X1 n=2 Tax=Fragaria vesca subsp. vesca TaxID=101020 RepID=UPI0002C36A9E|nr:PREDICTED: serine/arginine repetitive matrix protein 2 isoform X1 [Fragaria vesca subsp. vesca]XP_011464298.1 PREDICTED: serine/arginine repetitive matrix protein 2 isoform X1 [Fragaria vesca subsp. vesca]XP_011464299.1 PREDICTED: serine/arginine repetitive matrix protein 2 isoform X1 [Fragaria vesca subsp. vesca]
MYGQPNYGPPFAQGQTPMPPANQQRPPPLPPPPPPFTAPHNVVTSAAPPQPGPYLYQHGFVPAAHQSPPVLFSGMMTTGPSYGGNTWHNAQRPPTTGNQNFQRTHPPALVTPHAAPYPNMSQAAVPHGALPPPPPQAASAQSPAPPLPTAPSPSTSLQNLDPDHGSNKLRLGEMRGMNNQVTASNNFEHFTSVHEHSQNVQGGSECEKAGSLARDGVSSNGSVMLNISSPPPKPSDDIVHKIDSICQLSAMNEGKIESPSKSSQIDSSSQPDQFMVSSGYSLPADSDMEMEDDITLSDGTQEVHNSSDALNRTSDINHGELDVKKHLHGAQSSPEWTDPQGVSFEKVPSSLSECQLIIQGAPSRVDICSTGASESPLASQQEKSSIPKADDQNKLDASAAAEATTSDGFSNHITVNSPFRLLQDYASENSSEDGDVGIPPSSVTTNVKSSAKDAGSQFEIGSKNPCMTDKMSGRQYESRRSKFSLDTKKDVRSTDTTLIIESHEAFQGKDALNGSPIDIAFKRDKSQEGKKTKSECLPKVDEYGRLVREGSSDSNSDGSHYNKRRKRGRSRSRSRSRSRKRSRSRSRSPLDSRRRRSPPRRREKRNRSPSWSSRNQRGRSRSPTFRRAGEFRDENKRQDRRHIPECFDFLRGKCSRGGSCRYMHSEHDRNDGSWRHRNQQKHLEVQSSVKKSRINEEIEDSSDMRLHGEAKGQEMQIYPDMITKDGQFNDTDKTDYKSSKMTAATVQVKQTLLGKSEEHSAHNPESHHPSAEMLSSVDNMKSRRDTSQAIEQSRSINFAGEVQKAYYPSQQMEASLVSDSPPDRPSKTSPYKVSSIEPAADAILSIQSCPTESSNAQPLSSGQFSSQFLAPKESPLPGFSAANSPYPSKLPPPPPPSLSQGTSVAHVPQLHRDYSQRPPYPVQSIPTGTMHAHAYQGPLSNQPSQFPVSQESTWPSLPPPPPRPPYDSSLNPGTAAQDASSHFQQNHLAPRSDFGSQSSMRPYGSYPTESPHSKGEFLHQMYPTLSELPHPPPNREDFGSGNPSNQHFGGPDHMREDRFTHAPVQNVNPSHSFAQGHTHPQPPPPSQELTRIKMKNFSGDNFPVGELFNSSSQIHPHSHNQQPSYGVGDSILGVPGKTGAQYPVGGSILGFPGKDGPMSRYPPDMPDRSQFSQVPDFGESRIQTHHNPYAATFEQPLSFKFSSNTLIQGKNAPAANMFDTPVQVPVDGQGVGSAGSRQTTSSPSSAGAVSQLLRKSVSEQYDPLLDSIEPSGNPLNKHDQSQKHTATNDSNMMVRFSGSCEPLDVEENKKHTEVGPVASATSLDNDGYGETADAEVGVVEDESLSNDDGGANMAVGEMEIDQVKSGGKSRKKKDSRSTRLFKSAVADFVKDLLKPSWRQGNMSKEAFKTIVKKTVDKVSGAMKSHQIPKSEAKINHYIDSSQRKLTKLVMGYVDKYVKV